MTPRVVIETLDITFREGLRIEQMTALLQTHGDRHRPEGVLRAGHEPAGGAPRRLRVAQDLPEGASLEGFLYPDTYQVVTRPNGGDVEVTDAEALVRLLLDRFHEVVGEDRMNVPEDRGMTFYEIVTLASIVEHEAILDEERALIAGVYQNRLDGLRGVAKILNADPTVTYATDTMALEDLPVRRVEGLLLLEGPAEPAGGVRGPEVPRGLPDLPGRRPHPGPDLDARASPRSTRRSSRIRRTATCTSSLIPDSQEHAFAKTLAEHNENLRKYGYL